MAPERTEHMAHRIFQEWPQNIERVYCGSKSLAAKVWSPRGTTGTPASDPILILKMIFGRKLYNGSFRPSYLPALASNAWVD